MVRLIVVGWGGVYIHCMKVFTEINLVHISREICSHRPAMEDEDCPGPSTPSKRGYPAVVGCSTPPSKKWKSVDCSEGGIAKSTLGSPKQKVCFLF